MLRGVSRVGRRAFHPKPCAIPHLRGAVCSPSHAQTDEIEDHRVYLRNTRLRRRSPLSIPIEQFVPLRPGRPWMMKSTAVREYLRLNHPWSSEHGSCRHLRVPLDRASGVGCCDFRCFRGWARLAIRSGYDPHVKHQSNHSRRVRPRCQRLAASPQQQRRQSRAYTDVSTMETEVSFLSFFGSYKR